jgi:hypothetical protein
MAYSFADPWRTGKKNGRHPARCCGALLGEDAGLPFLRQGKKHPALRLNLAAR